MLHGQEMDQFWALFSLHINNSNEGHSLWWSMLFFRTNMVHYNALIQYTSVWRGRSWTVCITYFVKIWLSSSRVYFLFHQSTTSCIKWALIIRVLMLVWLHVQQQNNSNIINQTIWKSLRWAGTVALLPMTGHQKNNNNPSHHLEASSTARVADAHTHGAIKSNISAWLNSNRVVFMHWLHGVPRASKVANPTSGSKHPAVLMLTCIRFIWLGAVNV